MECVNTGIRQWVVILQYKTSFKNINISLITWTEELSKISKYSPYQYFVFWNVGVHFPLSVHVSVPYRTGPPFSSLLSSPHAIKVRLTLSHTATSLLLYSVIMLPRYSNPSTKVQCHLFHLFCFSLCYTRESFSCRDDDLTQSLRTSFGRPMRRRWQQLRRPVRASSPPVDIYQLLFLLVVFRLLLCFAFASFHRRFSRRVRHLLGTAVRSVSCSCAEDRKRRRPPSRN